MPSQASRKEAEFAKPGKDWSLVGELNGLNIKQCSSVKIALEKGGTYIFSGIQGRVETESGRRIKTALIRFPNSKNPPAELGFEIIMLSTGKPVLFHSVDQKTGKKIAEHKSEAPVKAIMVK